MSLINYHVVVTVIFVIAFVAMVIWVYLPRRKTTYDDIANQPLEDDMNRHAEQRSANQQTMSGPTTKSGNSGNSGDSGEPRHE